MMSKDRNDWDVSFSRIAFLEQLLQGHGNVVSVERQRDILFKIERVDGGELWVLCLDEYSFGMPALNRALAEFPTVNIISVGGNWNGYTPEAKDACLEKSLGLYNSSEINGGLWKDDYRNYVKKDEDGDPVYQYKSA